MDKKIVAIGVLVGSTVGGYAPVLFGVSAFSITSIICGGAGGLLGLWLAFKFFN